MEAPGARRYTAVYGRGSCSVTQKTLSFLMDNSYEFNYFDVDDKTVASSLHQKMKRQGISTERYGLPVVDFSGDLTIRPSNTIFQDRLNSPI